MKKPEPGDRVEVTDLYEVVREGAVQTVLSVQFTYLDDDGQVRFCMFSNHWRKIDG